MFEERRATTGNSFGPSRVCGSSRRHISGLHLILSLTLLGLAACATAPPVTPTMAKPNPTLFTPMPPPPPESKPEVPSGSLWAGGNNSLFQDIKARKVGDVVTITVNESAKGSKTGTTKTSKSKDFSGSFNFSGIGVGAAGVKNPTSSMSLGPYQGQFANNFSGNGATTREDTMSAYMTATVVDILPSGNLVIRGSRWTKVNDEMQQIVLEGVIRPMDITRDNTVLSQDIAEAKIFLVGKGPVAQNQKPGWFLQLLDFVSPF